MDGFLLIDKEKGRTSFDVVRDVRRKTGERRVGHGGTLDPLATGLLIVAVGKATKLLSNFLGCEKEYEVRARFGFVSDSYDAEGKIEKMSDGKIPMNEIKKEILQNFLGKISQCPPKYSALKIKGKRAADIMRAGGDVELKPRNVLIKKFEILDYEWPEVSFRIECGSGTYVRSLVHDLGQKLGVGAYVTQLRRTKVGDFDVREAGVDLIKIEDVANRV